jgi:ketosteroid isomerase-like protein
MTRRELLAALAAAGAPALRARDGAAGIAGDPDMGDRAGEDDRHAQTAATLAAVERFNEAFNRHDVDAVMAAMTADCVFERPAPPPDGTRYEGHDAVRAYWTSFFSSSPDARFEAEDVLAAGDRAVVRWIYRKLRDGRPWHLRGVDVFRTRDGRVAEKLAYVKG